ncbi:MAG: CocE/NonD family hydrolase [Nitrospirales bacterium]|nr:CocE/NonD family hydrolase [Nitrospirales bacterium]
MRDGIKIAIDVYLPAQPKKPTLLPTILHQTRYWRSLDYRWPWSWFKDQTPRGLMALYAQRFLEQGYAWVDMDVRGSGASFGSRPYAFSMKEIEDGAEIVEWIIQQPWSNGKIGALGISYGGTAAELLLVNQHPAVQAVAPMFSGFDLYSEIAFPGGVHLSWFTQTWSFINRKLDQNELPFSSWLTDLVVQGVRPVDEDTDSTLLQQAIKEHKPNWSPHQEALGLTFRDDVPPSHATTSIDCLSPQTYMETISQSGAAIYGYSGWFDGGYSFAAIKRFWAHNKPGHQLTLGPWDHGGKRHVSPINQGPAYFDHQAELLSFFDRHLKPSTGSGDEHSPVHYYTMVEERWKSANSWPPPSTKTPYYLDAHRSLSKGLPAAHPGFDRYPVDPSAGTGPHTRWNTLVGKPLLTPYPNRVTRTANLLAYTSPSLEHDMEVTGHPILTLFIKSTTPDATLFAYIDDVDESGNVTYVTEGMLRALHRQLQNPPAFYPTDLPYRTYTQNSGSPLQPHHVTRLVFDMLPISYQFKKGHQIRLTLSGADQDHFTSLPGPPSTLTFLFSETHPSRLDLPVVR